MRRYKAKEEGPVSGGEQRVHYTGASTFFFLVGLLGMCGAERADADIQKVSFPTYISSWLYFMRYRILMPYVLVLDKIKGSPSLFKQIIVGKDRGPYSMNGK